MSEQLGKTGTGKKQSSKTSTKSSKEIKDNTTYIQQHEKAIEKMVKYYELWSKAEDKQAQSAKRNQTEMLKWHNVAEATGKSFKNVSQDCLQAVDSAKKLRIEMDNAGKSKVPYSNMSTEYFRKQLKDLGIEVRNTEQAIEKSFNKIHKLSINGKRVSINKKSDNAQKYSNKVLREQLTQQADDDYYNIRKFTINGKRVVLGKAYNKVAKYEHGSFKKKNNLLNIDSDGQVKLDVSNLADNTEKQEKKRIAVRKTNEELQQQITLEEHLNRAEQNQENQTKKPTNNEPKTSKRKSRDAVRQVRGDREITDVYQLGSYDYLIESERMDKKGDWIPDSKRRTDFKQLEKDIISADRELIRLEDHFKEMENDNQGGNQALEQRITRQKDYIESLEKEVEVQKTNPYYNTQFQDLGRRRNEAQTDERLKISQRKQEQGAVNYRKEQEKIIKQQTAFEKRLDTMRSKANDKSRSKVASDSDLRTINSEFETLYNKITSIGKSGTLDINEVMDLDKALNNMQNLITKMENANHVATQLRTKDFDTVRATEKSGVEALISKYGKEGYLTSDIKSRLEDAKTGIGNSATVEDLIKQLNLLDRTKAEYKAIKEEKKAIESKNLFDAKKEKPTNDLNRYVKKLQEVGQYSGNIKKKIEEIQSLLGNAKTSNELEIAKAKLSGIRSEVTDIVKAATKPTSKKQNVLSFADKAAESLNNFKYRNQNIAGYNAITSQVQEFESRIASINSKGELNKFNIDLQRLQKSFNAPVTGWHNTTFASVEEALLKYRSLDADISNQVFNDGKIVAFTAKLKAEDGMIQRIKIDAKGAGGAIREMVFANPNVGLWERFSNQIKKSAAYYKNYLAGYMSMQYILRTVRTIANDIIALDDALIDINKTFQGSNAQLEQMYSNSNELAKQLGVTTEEVLKQEAAWSRAGYNTKEKSEEMTRMSSMFASISPSMDIDTAQTGLISVMKAFDIQTDDVERKILDNINAVGNAFATTNTEIIEGLQRSSSAMASANNSLEQTVALFTGGQEIVQNAETMGAALKTMSMRIRGYDEETEELTDSYQNLSGEIADLTKTAKTQGGISLFEDDAKTQYKSTYQILKEISEIWDDLTDKNRAQLLEKLFAKTRAQAGAAILSNFDSVENALSTMENADGSADKEMENIRKSISYNLNELKQTWIGIWQELADRGDVVKVIDALTKLSEAIAFVVEHAGGLGTIATVLAPILGAKGSGLM